MSLPLTELSLEGTALLARVDAGSVGALDGGWQITSAIPHHEGGTLIVLGRPDSRATLGLQVRPRDDAARAWQRTPHLDLISHLPPDMPEPEGLRVLAPLVSRLQALDGPATVVSPGPEPGDAAPPARALALDARWLPEATSPFAFGRVFVLDLQSDCGQACSFCSTRAKFSPQTTFGAGELSRHEVAMAAARRAGYDVLRLSGLDPLTHPDVTGLVAAAVRLGFRHVHIYSPFTRLADAAAREALLEALGEVDYTLHVPLYGPNADVHEAVTGVEGSFDAVCAALDGLVGDGAGDALTMLTVLTRQNLPHVHALSQLLRRWAVPVQVFLPFPTTRASDDAFFDVATTHSALVGPLSTCEPPMGLAELWPCVRYRHEVATGAPALSSGGFHPTTALLGTLFEHADYRRAGDVSGNTFTIPVRRCPHASACALATLCPGVAYAAYADRFGLDEMAPVSRLELEACSPEVARLSRPA